MKTSKTAGGLRDFRYSGDLKKGITVHFATVDTFIPAELFNAIQQQFASKSIRGGFSMTNPPADGLGYFVRSYSKDHLNRTISPRYASHIAAILRDHGMVSIAKDGRTVMLSFP